MNNRHKSWIMALALGFAAALLVLRRRIQEEQEIPQLPLPDPPEPPRIVLPQALLETEERHTSDNHQSPSEQPRERAVGEKQPASRASGPGSQSGGSAGPRKNGARPARSAKQAPAPEESDELTGYCMRCREHRSIAKPEQIVTESGRNAVTGSCAECGTRIFRFVAAKD